MEEALTLKQAASYLRVSESLLRKYVRQRRVPHFRVGKLLRFWLRALTEWANAHSCGGEQAYNDKSRKT